MTEPAAPGRLKAAMIRAEQGAAVADAADGPTEIAYTERVGDGRTLSIGPAVETVLGYSQEEWMADPLLWEKLLHPEDQARVVQACAAANETRRRFQADYRMIARDGRVIRIHDEAALVFGRQGDPLCWEGLMVASPPDS